MPGRRGEWLLSSQATFVGFEMTTAELDWHTDKGWKDGVRKAAAFVGVQTGLSSGRPTVPVRDAQKN